MSSSSAVNTVDELCVDVLCVDELCVDELCVDVLCNGSRSAHRCFAYISQPVQFAATGRDG